MPPPPAPAPRFFGVTLSAANRFYPAPPALQPVCNRQQCSPGRPAAGNRCPSRPSNPHFRNPPRCASFQLLKYHFKIWYKSPDCGTGTSTDRERGMLFPFGIWSVACKSCFLASRGLPLCPGGPWTLAVSSRWLLHTCCHVVLNFSGRSWTNHHVHQQEAGRPTKGSL